MPCCGKKESSPSGDIVVRTPIPKLKACIIAIVTISDGISLSFYNSFLALMIQYQFDVNDENVGFYAGMVASAFYLGQLFSSFPLGYASDRLGRKPVLLLGLVANGVCQIGFGLSSYFWLAILFRFINGLFNNNVSTIKTYVRDVSDSTNQAKMYSVRTIGMAFGGVVGPLIGGLFARPVTKGWIGESSAVYGFFTNYPYSLCCFIASATSFLALALSIFFLAETAVLKKKNKNKPQYTTVPTEDIESGAAPSGPGNINDHVLTDVSEDLLNFAEPESWFKRKLGYLTRGVVTTVLLYGLSSLFITMALQVFLVWGPRDAVNMGLGLDEEKFGLLNAISAIAPIIFQVALFTKIDRCIGSLWSFRLGLVIFLPTVFCMPWISEVNTKMIAMWVLLFIVTPTLMTLSSWIYAAINITIMNAATKDAVGRVNGWSSMVSAFMRVIAPVVGTSLFAVTAKYNGVYPLNYVFAFHFSCWICAGSLLFSFLVPPYLNRKRVPDSTK